MKFNSKTLGALLAIAALSFAATSCSGETEVRYVEVPATASEADEAVVEATTPEATAPEATDVPFTLPVATAPEVTEAPVTVPPVVETDYANDLILDDFEFDVVVQVLTEAGYGHATKDTSEELGLSFCILSNESATPDEFYESAYDAIVAAGLDVDEIGFAIGALMSAMCADEVAWLDG